MEPLLATLAVLLLFAPIAFFWCCCQLASCGDCETHPELLLLTVPGLTTDCAALEQITVPTGCAYGAVTVDIDICGTECVSGADLDFGVFSADPRPFWRLTIFRYAVTSEGCGQFLVYESNYVSYPLDCDEEITLYLVEDQSCGLTVDGTDCGEYPEEVTVATPP